ncbi:MAG: DUF6058 family natural product biosynthesis protein [Thermoplasmata archaeon]
MSTPSPQISAEDDRYIRSRFVGLDWLVARTKVSRATFLQWQSQGLFPKPTYVTAEGEQWYSRAYAPLVLRAMYVKTDLKTLFREDYSRALEQLRYTNPADYRAELAKSGTARARPEAVIELEWQGFLSGEYGACLRVAWVPCILRKGKLMRTIDELVAHPNPEAPGWKRRLRQSVDSLDRLEMPFTAWDRVRFGKPVSRDTHIQSIRLRFPHVFGPPRSNPPADRHKAPHPRTVAA